MTRVEAIKILKEYAPRIKPFYEPQRTEYPQAIEAVKHSTAYMHDDLYEAISIRIPSAETTGALDDAIAKYVTDGLMELPSAEAEWIPCSERLPSESGWYLVTVQGYETVTDVSLYSADGYSWGDVSAKQRVIAWMPLPKPYREEDEE